MLREHGHKGSGISGLFWAGIAQGSSSARASFRGGIFSEMSSRVLLARARCIPHAFPLVSPSLQPTTEVPSPGQLGLGIDGDETSLARRRPFGPSSRVVRAPVEKGPRVHLAACIRPETGRKGGKRHRAVRVDVRRGICAKCAVRDDAREGVFRSTRARIGARDDGHGDGFCGGCANQIC